MSDKINFSSEPDRLTSNIWRAMSAYTELGTQLADLIRPLQDQWASIASSVRDQMQAAMEPGMQWAEDLQNNQRTWQERIAEWSSSLAVAQAVLTKEIAQAGPRLRRTLERADHVGRLGWTMTLEMTLPDMARFSEIKLPSEADTYMQEWYDEYDADLTRSEMRILELKELESFRTVLLQ
jgi:hypothetical protein